MFLAQESIHVPQESILVAQESILVRQESILAPQESILEAQESNLVPQESILVRQESILIDFSKVFQCFWPATAATAAGNPPAIREQSAGNFRHKSGTARRTPQGRIQESFFPLEEPYSETLLGKN